MQHVLPSLVSRRGHRAALAVIGALAALAVALPASASAAAFTAHVKFPNHTPVANKHWPITVTATRGRTKLSGTVSYRFLLGSTVEATRKGVSFRNGVAHDFLVFPGLAVGHRLTLQVVVKTRYGARYVNWAVTTKQ
jgi:hypothetical protein